MQLFQQLFQVRGKFTQILRKIRSHTCDLRKFTQILSFSIRLIFSIFYVT